MELKNILFEEKEKIGWITLNRPSAMNALNSSVIRELKEVIDYLNQGSCVQCIVLRGAGEKAFAAGADIKEIHDLDISGGRQLSALGHEVFSELEKLAQPVIAAVHGFALGGGLELALACDFIYCSEKAQFGLPESTLGLIPGFGGTIRLSRRIGLARAREFIYSGQFCNAQRAYEIGLVNHICSSQDLMPTVEKLAKTISSRGPLAIASAKTVINQGWDMELEQGLAIENDYFASLFGTQDVAEGTSAFIEKRKPEFKGE